MKWKDSKDSSLGIQRRRDLVSTDMLKTKKIGLNLTETIISKLMGHEAKNIRGIIWPQTITGQSGGMDQIHLGFWNRFMIYT